MKKIEITKFQGQQSKDRQVIPQKNHQFDEELSRLVSLKNAGFDPQVKMHTLKRLIGESRSTIYRKIKLSKFPKQIKRGRNSYWKFSEIEAYLNGQ